MSRFTRTPRRSLLTIFWLGAWLVLNSVPGTPTSAWAEEPIEATPEARKKAAEHYQRGVEHFEKKQFKAAVAEYRKAYELSAAPLLLFNIGLAYRADGKAQEAVDVLREFIREQPQSDISNEAREYIVALDEKLADERAERDRAAARRGALERRQRAAGRKLRITGLVLASTSLALLSTGVVFGVNARGIHNDLENHLGPWEDDQLARIDDGEAAERNAIILTTVGGAMLIAGAVTYVLGMRKRPAAESAEPAQAVTVVPTLAADRAGLLVTGRF